MRVNHGLTPQDLKAYGINDVQDIVHNPSYDMLFQEELDPNLEGYERGVLTTLGAIAVDTGIFTGRSPKDKYLVRDDTTFLRRQRRYPSQRTFHYRSGLAGALR